ncbi:MAG: hypothetical protein A2511_05090 [Deltaproteobacteria bacterium RIFOXYD12_FULL_50_9]|nr:MAG: hypothetical protein A2511_05090 [Deltaproteobacteria bacterium RIFOXYD12_FULL_50_9]
MLIAFLSIFLPLLLYIFREMDDNRLTSWNWVFTPADLPIFISGLLLAVLLAYLPAQSNRWPTNNSLLLIATAILAVPFWQEPEVIVDAARYFTQAKLLATHGIGYFFRQWGKEVFAWTDLPLTPFLYGLIFKFLGEDRLYIQILNTIFMTGTILLTSRLGQLLWDKETGFYGGILLLCIPYLLTQVPLMLVDVPTTFFLMLAIVSFVQAVTKGGAGNILWAGFALFLAFFAKYSTWILLSIHGLIALVLLNSHSRIKVFRRASLTFLLALLLISLAFLHFKGVMIDQMLLLNTYQKPGLQRWSESLISTFFFQTHPFIPILALASAWIAWRARDARYLIIIFPVLLITVILQIKRIRYTIPIFPLLTLMAAYCIARIPTLRVKRFLILCMLNTSLFIALAGFLPFLRNMSDSNIMAAGRFLNDRGVKHARVVPIPMDNDIINPTVFVPLLDLFTTTRLNAIAEPVPKEIKERFQTSSLRFTWEFILPDFYAEGTRPLYPDALVTLSGTEYPSLQPPLGEVIKNYANRRDFNQASGIFQHNTFVTVFYN